MVDKTISLSMKSKDKLYNGIITISDCPFERLREIRKDFLHMEEEMVFNSYPFQSRQFSYLQGKYSAKKALSALLNVPPGEILIDSGIFFQPIVKTEMPSHVKISVSHSKNISVGFAFDERILAGIDVEFNNHSKNWVELISATDEEKKLSYELSENQHILFWCSKESLAKALQIGFTSDLQIFEINGIRKTENYVEVSFRFFPHFKSYVFMNENFCIAIALPGNIDLDSSEILEIGHEITGF
ncbi:4'-phosphopantetheinyl transferase superfamily protein [Chryseobacterium sp. MYb264]|uniref:4'-phosphopantetheinyl transferase family protein n=1 Tax=Chryseobacterium sp. MYb264 TaxID=2745153 RepID=UPI002E15CAE0|nr:4'-phosphopantetheinyl transferase superfamily protein [Chryseobacterium sp. MYb264]